jgi:large subunit ribosomal protein L4e
MAPAALPTVAVQGGGSCQLPEVFLSPIRPDLVNDVHTSMAKNNRQAYAVFNKAGHQTAAESWGTGRAVSRIPRVPGGGTHRAGQGAFGNMCRGGRMFAPTKTFRRWHRRINKNTRRYAVSSAVAASSVPALVMARGHRIDDVPEIPCVVSDDVQGLSKTKDAIAFLQGVGALADAERVKQTQKTRSGVGKYRNRRTINKKGPLIVYAENHGVQNAFHNIPGVDTANVSRLNLLSLAPGGHLGRFVIWTESAFAKLDQIFGTNGAEAPGKKGFTLPRSIMANADVSRIVGSAEVKAALRPKGKTDTVLRPKRSNPLRSVRALRALNPHAVVLKGSAKGRSLAKKMPVSKKNVKKNKARIQKANKAKKAPTLLPPPKATR